MGGVGGHLEEVIIFNAGEERENVFFELGADVIFTSNETHCPGTGFIIYR